MTSGSHFILHLFFCNGKSRNCLHTVLIWKLLCHLAGTLFQFRICFSYSVQKLPSVSAIPNRLSANELSSLLARNTYSSFSLLLPISADSRIKNSVVSFCKLSYRRKVRLSRKMCSYHLFLLSLQQEITKFVNLTSPAISPSICPARTGSCRQPQ